MNFRAFIRVYADDREDRRRGRRVARLVCTVVRDSRHWSEGPDHAVYGRNDLKLRSCQS